MNIVQLANIIRAGMRTYLDQHPDCIDQKEVVKAGVGCAMRFGRGKFNPDTIFWLAMLEDEVYKGHKISKEGFLQC